MNSWFVAGFVFMALGALFWLLSRSLRREFRSTGLPARVHGPHGMAAVISGYLYPFIGACCLVVGVIDLIL